MGIGERNLARLAQQAFQRLGDHESTFFGGRWYRSGDLFERSRRLAGGFTELGVQPGDRVVVMMANSPDVGVCYNALWRAGAAITPAIFLLPPDELRHILVSSRAVGIVTTPDFLLTIALASEGVDTLRWIVCTDPPEHDERYTPLEKLASAEAADITPRTDDDLAALLFTGGTTGRAKGVMLSHENLWFCARSSHEASYVPGVNRTLMPLPLAHAFGLAVTVTGMHAEEPGKAILQQWFDPQGFLELAVEHGAQRATMVPSMMQMLLAEDLESHDLSSLRFVNIGAAPLARETIAEFERRVPSVEVLEGYGCTESGGIISSNRPGERKLGTVGVPLPGYEVRIAPLDELDDETSQASPPSSAAVGAQASPSGSAAAGAPTSPSSSEAVGAQASPSSSEAVGAQLGEIVCRSAGVMQGYWEAEEATAETLRDGWLHTGDIGSVDDDGYITIVDRVKDLIIRGGFNVYPRDVEDALVEHPAVAMAGVVGRPDDRLGEEVVAFVQLHPGQEIQPDDLVAFGKERLGGYKYPREVHLTEAMPLTPVGKLDRKSLRKLL